MTVDPADAHTLELHQESTYGRLLRHCGRGRLVECAGVRGVRWLAAADDMQTSLGGQQFVALKIIIAGFSFPQGFECVNGSGVLVVVCPQ